MRLIDADKALAHIHKRLLETAINNALVPFGDTVCDISLVYLDIAVNRLETWINEIPTADIKNDSLS